MTKRLKETCKRVALMALLALVFAAQAQAQAALAPEDDQASSGAVIAEAK